MRLFKDDEKPRSMNAKWTSFEFSILKYSFKNILTFKVWTFEEQEPRQQLSQSPHQLLLPMLPLVITTLRTHGQICITKWSTGLTPKWIWSSPLGEECSSPAVVPCWEPALVTATPEWQQDSRVSTAPGTHPALRSTLRDPFPVLHCMEGPPQPIRTWGQLPAG